MAVNLNTSSSGAGEDIKKQIERENNLKFKIIKYGFIALAVAFTVKSAIGVFGNYESVQDLSVQIEQKQTSFDKLKAEVEQWHLENDKASTNLDQETGTVVSEVQLPSARDAGIEAASLQNKLLDNGGLLYEDEQRLTNLVKGRYGSAQAWFGASLLPGSVEWEFATWYDGEANVEAYECVWECWRNEDGTDYLVAIAVGTYNVRAENFDLDTVYVTSFGTMLVENGAIKAKSAENTDDNGVGEMVDELTGNGDGSSDTSTDEGAGDGSSEGVPDGDGGSQGDGNAPESTDPVQAEDENAAPGVA